jgi:hypothetical protein
VVFTLADGTLIKRAVSECRFEIRGEAATSPVVLGEEHDGALLGAVTLKTLGFMPNPLTRDILPMRMALSHLRNPNQATTARAVSTPRCFLDWPVVVQFKSARIHCAEKYFSLCPE